MAARDHSQGIGFVYTNLYELYKKSQAAQALQKEDVKSTKYNVFRPEDLGQVKVTKFHPLHLNSVQAATPGVTKVFTKATQTTVSSFEDLKTNLNRLVDLHSKLQFMLKELEGLVGKKKS